MEMKSFLKCVCRRDINKSLFLIELADYLKFQWALFTVKSIFFDKSAYSGHTKERWL